MCIYMYAPHMYSRVWKSTASGYAVVQEHCTQTMNGKNNTTQSIRRASPNRHTRNGVTDFSPFCLLALPLLPCEIMCPTVSLR